MGVVSGPPIVGNDSSEKEWGKYESPGDLKHMKCHDIFCMVVFLVFFIAAIVIMAVGVSKGKLWSLYNSWDTLGQYCGKNNVDFSKDVKNGEGFPFQDLTDYPYLFFDALNVSNQICVRECPQENDIFDVFAAGVTDIVSDPDPSLKTLDDGENLYLKTYYTEAGSVYQYKSKNVFNRCVPDVDTTKLVDFENFTEAFNAMVDSIPSLATALSSVANLWVQILVCCIISLLVAFIWICLLRLVTGCIVYVVVFLVPILLIAIGVFLFIQGDIMDTLTKIQETESLTSAQITAIVLWIIALIILLIIIFLFKKLKSAVQMIKIAAKALGANIGVILVPIISMVIAIAFWAIILVSSVFIYTAADFEVIEGKIEFTSDKSLQYCLIYNFIYLIFISVHVYFTNYYATSAPIVNWYFNSQGNFGCGCGCWRGFCLAFSKGLGTITVSSIIMTPLYLFILFMEYLDAKARQENVSAIIQCLIKCCKCCLKCFTNIIKYLNKTLLTIQQIFNKNWWNSAQIVTDVVISDAVMATLLNGVSYFILFLSKVVVGGICALIFCLWVDSAEAGTAGYLLSAFIVFFLSFIISSFILSAYDNVIDIVYVCYQSGNAIPNYSPGDQTSELQETIEEAKKLHDEDEGGSAEMKSSKSSKSPRKSKHEHEDENGEVAVHYGD